jgi:serine/threonine protein kinase
MMLLKQKQIFVLLWNCNYWNLLSKEYFFYFNIFRITGGELFERVIDDDFILTERLCELYMMQICEGVNFMHSCNIIHLDMKVRDSFSMK